MVNTIDYQQAVAELEESLDEIADHAHHILVMHGDGDEDNMSLQMQRVYAKLALARARGMASIDAVFSQVETKQ